MAVRTKNGLRSNLRVSKYKNWPGEGRVGKKGGGGGGGGGGGMPQLRLS